jgi:RNA polymerase sigma factor (sigma-70 family)
MKLRATTRIRNDDMIVARKAKGLSQGRLGDLVGCGVGVVAAIEALQFKGTNTARWVHLIAEELGLESQEVAPQAVWDKDFTTTRIDVMQVPNDRLLEMATTTQQRLTLPSPEEELSQEDVKDRISRHLVRMPHREKEVLQLRFGLGEDGMAYTLGEAAKIFKVTKEWIRQVEARAMRRLQSMEMAYLKGADVTPTPRPGPKIPHPPETTRKQCRQVELTAHDLLRREPVRLQDG